MLEIVLVFAGLCALFALVVVGLCIYEEAEFVRDDIFGEAMRDWWHFERKCGEPKPVEDKLDWWYIREGARHWFEHLQTWGFTWPIALRKLVTRPEPPIDPWDEGCPTRCDVCGRTSTSFHPHEKGLACLECHNLSEEICPVDKCDFCHEPIPNADGLWVFVGGCYPTTGLACPACYFKYTGYFGTSTEADPTPTNSQQAYRAAYSRT